MNLARYIAHRLCRTGTSSLVPAVAARDRLATSTLAHRPDAGPAEVEVFARAKVPKKYSPRRWF